MENSNKKRKFKPGQGKTLQQYTDSTRFAWYGVVGMIILLFLVSLLGGCATIQPTKECCEKIHVLTDAEYSDVRESHASVTYFHESDGCFYKSDLIKNEYGIYWGWYEGFYYYYGISHHYPWYYYYDKIPPSYYDLSTHIVIKKPKIKLKSYGFKRTNKTTTRRR